MPANGRDVARQTLQPRPVQFGADRVEGRGRLFGLCRGERFDPAEIEGVARVALAPMFGKLCDQRIEIATLLARQRRRVGPDTPGQRLDLIDAGAALRAIGGREEAGEDGLLVKRIRLAGAGGRRRRGVGSRGGDGGFPIVPKPGDEDQRAIGTPFVG